MIKKGRNKDYTEVLKNSCFSVGFCLYLVYPYMPSDYYYFVDLVSNLVSDFSFSLSSILTRFYQETKFSSRIIYYSFFYLSQYQVSLHCFMKKNEG